MKRFIQSTRGLAMGLVLAGGAQQATAQFVAVNNYQAPQQVAVPATSYQAPPAGQYTAAPYSPAQYAPAQYSATQPTAPPAYATQPSYGYPRVAQAGELPTPAETVAPSVEPVTPVTPAVPYTAGHQHATTYSQPMSYSAPSASAGCATGQCGTSYSSAPVATYATPVSGDCGATYGGGCYSQGCDYGSCDAAPACSVSAPVRRRQWFGGIYGLYMERAGDQSKAAVAYLTDTAAWTPPVGATGYYMQPSDTCLHTTDAGYDSMFGAEIRFGSTFGGDACGCAPTCAWEIGYWALGDDESSAQLTLPGAVSSTYTPRLYSLYNYNGLYADLDGAGTDWTNRPIYTDDGRPASLDLFDSDVRILGVRVRQRFSMQNLELNFWRFGTPTCAPSLGGGRIASRLHSGAAACGVGSYGGGCDPCGYDSCGVGAGCAPVACAPSRPPRRFFINGLMGVRYLRVDDDFGLDWQFADVDVPPSGNAGNVPVRTPPWTASYTGFPADSNQVIFSDYEAENELVGFQLGCSMNWLVGCKWNVFADTNFGIYGNNADVYKRVYGGGASEVTFYNGGGAAVAHGSETTVSTLGELRTGVGYQVTCNCRLTVAYRLMGITGVALGAEEFQNTNWSNAETASHIDVNNSIVVHGLQTGVECKY